MENFDIPAHRPDTTQHAASPDPARMPCQAATWAFRERLAVGDAPLTPDERAAVVEVLACAVTTVDVAHDGGEDRADVGVLAESVDRLAALCAGEGRPRATTLLDVGDDDPRFTMTLVDQVAAVLREHDYHEPAEEWDRNNASGRALIQLGQLVRVFEGRAQR